VGTSMRALRGGEPTAPCALASRREVHEKPFGSEMAPSGERGDGPRARCCRGGSKTMAFVPHRVFAYGRSSFGRVFRGCRGAKGVAGWVGVRGLSAASARRLDGVGAVEPTSEEDDVKSCH
jgi:hypothetical protein